MKRTLLSMLAMAGIIGSASAFEADLDGTIFEIDTIYCRVIGPGVTCSHLTLSAPGRNFNIYTSTLRRSEGATAGMVEPRVIIGNDQCRLGESITSMAERHDAMGDYRHLSGINGDFFIVSAFAQQHEFGEAILGYPNMSCVIDRKIAAPDLIDVVSRENALITTNDNWYIDATDITYRLLSTDGSVVINASGINYPRRDGELMFYNSYMGATTATSDSGRELLLRPAQGSEWVMNQPIRFVVDGAWRAGGNSEIPADGLVLSCGPNYSNTFVDGLGDGDQVDLLIGLSLPDHGGITPDVVNVIGGDVRILRRGEITREAIRWINTPGSPYQRSIVGFSEDRDMMVFVAVDGSGLNYYECAALLRVLGCYDGLDMDGGGSTAIWNTNFGVYNNPRDGSLRAVGNGLFYALKAPADNEIVSIRFADHAVVLPRFGSYTPVIFGYNQYGQLVDTDIQDFELSAPAELGVVEGKTLLASGSGMHALTATYNGMSATVAVDVDASYPIAPRYSALLIDNYRTVPVQLYADVRGEAVDVAPGAFDWTSDNAEVVTVDADGNLTGHADGTAVVTATAGDLQFSVDVTVQCPVAHAVPLSPDTDASQWRSSGTGLTVTSCEVGEDPDFAFAFTLKSGASHRITLRRNVVLYSLPDAIRLTLDTKGAPLTAITLNVSPNGQRAVSLKKDYDGASDVVEFAMSELFDVNDPGVYPLSFGSLIFEFEGTSGDFAMDVNALEVVYNNFEDGVESVVIDEQVLRPMILGSDIVLPYIADVVELSDLTGRTIQRATAVSTISAPAAGLYILATNHNGRTECCKLVVR